MTNDLTTIEGSLQEVIDRLETNLASKGVNATYSSSTGILGLVDQISNISQSSDGSSGVPCYHVEFTDNSLNYSDWSFTQNSHVASLEVYLQYQYAPFAGNVTISDGTNSYTVTTDATGIGKLEAPLSASSTTFTASYTNTTDTITVTKSTFHFIDKCDSSSNLSHYGTSEAIYTSSSGTPASTIEYDNTLGTYKVYPTNSSTTYYSMIPITDLNNKTNYIFECKIYCDASKSSNDIGIYCDNSSDTTSVGYGVTLNIYNHRLYGRGFVKTGSSYSRNNVDITTANSIAKHWYTLRVKVTDTTFYTDLYNANMNLITSFTYNQTISNKQFGILVRGGTTSNNTNHIKDIKVKSIATS